jgi:hypothetical protein
MEQKFIDVGLHNGNNPPQKHLFDCYNSNVKQNEFLNQNLYSESEVQAKDKEILELKLEIVKYENERDLMVDKIEKLQKDNARLKLRVKYQWKED